MKRIVLVVGVICSLLCVANAQDVVCQKDDSQLKCMKDIDNLSKRAKFYQKKAGLETNKDLATVYSKCADAKQKMADGYTKIYENSQKCEKICTSNPEIMSAVCGGKMKGCMQEKKKRTHMSTRAKNIQECADFCVEKAKKAEQEGKKELEQQYNEIAAALQEKSEGYKLIGEANKEFKDARKELKELTSKTDTKTASAE